MSPLRAPSPQAGFTLVELLVSLTLLGFLMAALFGGIRFVGRAEERGSAALARTSLLDGSRELLRRDIGRAFPIAVGADDGIRFLFTGRPQRLAFPVLDPPEHGMPGLSMAVFDIESLPAGGSRLVYRRYPFGAHDRAVLTEAPARSSVLAEVPFPLSFAYRGGDGDWLSSWSAPRDLPRLIRLRAGGGTIGEAAPWPDLILWWRVDGDAACLHGAAAGLPCRSRPTPDGEQR